MRLTIKQKEVLLNATKEQDYCVIAHKKTMAALVDKGLAKYDSGFGYRFGAIISLTEYGKKLQNTLDKKIK